MLAAEQIGFTNIIEENSYNNNIEYLRKEIHKALLNSQLTYTCTKHQIKEWVIKNYFSNPYIYELENQDIYYVAQELCNMKLVGDN